MKNADLKTIRQTNSSGQAGKTTDARVTNRTTGRTQQNRATRDNGITARAFLVVVLSITLVGVLHWAVDITTGNAKIISDNLRKMQNHFDKRSNDTGNEQMGVRTNSDGPVIEPRTP